MSLFSEGEFILALVRIAITATRDRCEIFCVRLLSICVLVARASPPKKLNRWRCRLNGEHTQLLGLKEPYIRQ